MPLMPMNTILAAGGCFLIAAGANAQMSDNGSFSGSGQTLALDCHAGKASVAGSNNVLSFSGKCSRLDLSGSNNRIRIELGADAQIDVAGSDNAISWTPIGGPPHIRAFGPNNIFDPPVK